VLLIRRASRRNRMRTEASASLKKTITTGDRPSRACGGLEPSELLHG
jgi:hypothetical protein